MIRVDDRVGSREFVSRIADLHVPVKMLRLPAADFAFQGKGRKGPVQVGIERKTIMDFISSYQSGRFTSHQLPALCKGYDYVVLLLEGAYRQSFYGMLESYVSDKWVPMGMPWSAFEGVLHTLAFRAQVQIRHTWGAVETTHLVVSMWKWWRKGWEEHESLMKPVVLGPKMNPRSGFFVTPRSDAERLALVLPGVGAVGARYAAKKFRTPAGLYKATRLEWGELPGIGPTKAKRIWEFLHD